MQLPSLLARSLVRGLAVLTLLTWCAVAVVEFNWQKAKVPIQSSPEVYGELYGPLLALRPPLLWTALFLSASWAIAGMVFRRQNRR